MFVFIILIKKTNLLFTLADSRTSAVQPQQLIPAQVHNPWSIGCCQLRQCHPGDHGGGNILSTTISMMIGPVWRTRACHSQNVLSYSRHICDPWNRKIPNCTVLNKVLLHLVEEWENTRRPLFSPTRCVCKKYMAIDQIVKSPSWLFFTCVVVNWIYCLTSLS